MPPPAFSMRSFMRCRLALRAPATNFFEASGDCDSVLMPRFLSSASSFCHRACSDFRLATSCSIAARYRISRLFGESAFQRFWLNRMCRSVEKNSGRMRYLM